MEGRRRGGSVSCQESLFLPLDWRGQRTRAPRNPSSLDLYTGPFISGKVTVLGSHLGPIDSFLPSCPGQSGRCHIPPPTPLQDLELRELTERFLPPPPPSIACSPCDEPRGSAGFPVAPPLRPVCLGHGPCSRNKEGTRRRKGTALNPDLTAKTSSILLSYTGVWGLET